jgi:hypothetical protein
MSVIKTRRDSPATKMEARAISLSADLRSIYVAVCNAMFEEAGGNSEDFQQASKWQFREALDALGLCESEERENALNDLTEAAALYWCLKGSLDRTPKFTILRDNLRTLRTHIEQLLSNLDQFEKKSVKTKQREDGSAGARKQMMRSQFKVADERQFIDELYIRTAPLVAGQVVRARLFELKTRQYLTISLRRLEALLAPIDNLNIKNTRGQPRKYSKDFLLLRCLRLFQKYGHHEGVTRWKESNRKRVEDPAYGGPLVGFVRHVLGAVDTTVNLGAKFGLGKSIEETRRLLTRVSDVDELVRQDSSDEELLRFSGHCESIRAKAKR